MAVKIHGVPQSTCVRRVAVVLKELNVPYEIVPVSVQTGEHKSEKYLSEMQPFGVIPVLEDEDGFKIFESRAIGRYLVAKYGKDSGLIPSDIKSLGLFEQAASIETSYFDHPAFSITKERIFKPMFHKLPTDEVAVKEYEANLTKALDGYERILSKTKYLAGDSITLADLFHLPYGYMVFEQIKFTDPLTSHPKFAAWWKSVTERPSWQAVKDGA